VNRLEVVANLAAILTAFAAAGVAAYLWLDSYWKRKKLLDYLRKVKLSANAGEESRRTILQLMARLGMTEAEILHASFESQHVKRTLATDAETGRADAILLEYEHNGNSN